MRQLITLSTWRAVGNAEARPSGNGVSVRLCAQKPGEVAKLYFPLPPAAWETPIRALVRLRLVDPWRETITLGVSDSAGEVITRCQLTADQMLSRVVIDKHCRQHPELFFSLTGPFASLRLYLEDILVEGKKPRPAVAEKPYGMVFRQY